MKYPLLRLCRQFIIYLLLGNILLLFSNMPIAVYLSKSIPGKVFQFVHGEWIHDYYSYLAYITEGKEGLWLKKSPYSIEPQTPGIFHIYFVLAGKLGAVFHLDPRFNYHLIRLLTAQFYLLAVYLLSSVVLDKKYSFMGAIFILIGTVAPPYFFKTKIWTDNYPFGNPFWENFDALQRLYALPHHLFGQAAATLSAACFFLFVRKRKILLLFAAVITATFATIIFPPMLLPLALGVLLSWVLFFLTTYFKTRQIQIDKRIIFALFLYLLVLGLIVLILQFQEKQGYQWSQTRSWEILRWNKYEPNIDHSLFFLFGILPIFALPSAVYNIIKRNWSLIFVTVWACLPFLLLPFVELLWLSKIRLAQINSYIPLGILCADTIYHVIPKLKINYLKTILLTLFLTANLGVIIYLFILRYQSISTHANYRLDSVYMRKSTYDSLDFIQNTVPKNSIFLSSPIVGLVIPSYSRNTSFIAHLTDTYNYAQKEKEMIKFFSNSMTDTEAELFLKNNGINFVYFGLDEKQYSNQLNYSFLKEYYNKDDVQIYRVN